jgi:Ca-activated chloride channel family protein
MMRWVAVTLMALSLSQLRVESTLVQIPVSVLDKAGRPINDLTKEHFSIVEDKTPQTISLFKREDVPMSVGLVIDNSGSMRRKRDRVNSAALTFVRESNPEDETFIVNFDDTAYVDQEFTGSIGDLMDALDNFDTRGETALYDAIYLAADKAVKQGRRDTKALLLISDGLDNRSKYKYDDVLKKLKESRVTMYAIGLGDDAPKGLFAPPDKKAQQILSSLAEITGGLAYFPKSMDEVEELCRQIARDLRNRYTLGYTPSNTKLDGAWREVKVAVTPSKAGKVDARHKPGYFAPTASKQ